MTVKDLSYPKINRLNPSYFITNKLDEQIEEDNENKYLTLVPTDGNKDTSH